jgi:glycosyltransferase involved in cell wall biosynthesis
MLLANFTYPEDGRVRREATALTAGGHRVWVVCPHGEGQRWRERINGVDVLRYPLLVEGRGAVSYVLEFLYVTVASFALSLWIKAREGIDVVHLHNPPDVLIAVGAFHKLFGARIVFDHHDLAPEMYRARFGERASSIVFRALVLLERLSCRLADHVVTANESYREVELTRHRLAPDRATVVRNGPELGRLRPVPEDPELRDGAATVICYAGVIGPQDGVDHLVRAIHHLVGMGHTDIHCTIVGDGDALTQLRVMVDQLGLEHQIRFTGRLGVDELVRHICSADVCVEPAPSNSYNDRSTMIKVMEYMALRRPVVAFDLPENRVSAADSAVYVTPNDDEALAHAIATLASDKEKRLRLGACGRQRVEQELSWDLVAPRLLEAYGSVLGTSA